MRFYNIILYLFKPGLCIALRNEALRGNKYECFS